MNQRLINKIKLFDKLASEALIAKKAGIFSVSEEEKKTSFFKS